MSKSEELLQEILEELRALRSDVAEIQGVLPIIRPSKDLDDISVEFDGLADRITGVYGESLGSDLGDVVRAIESLESTIALK